jgi:hypothetical protein
VLAALTVLASAVLVRTGLVSTALASTALASAVVVGAGLACTALTRAGLGAQVLSEPGEFCRDGYHFADNHHGWWPDTLIR